MSKVFDASYYARKLRDLFEEIEREGGVVNWEGQSEYGPEISVYTWGDTSDVVHVSNWNALGWTLDG